MVVLAALGTAIFACVVPVIAGLAWPEDYTVRRTCNHGSAPNRSLKRKAMTVRQISHSNHSNHRFTSARPAQARLQYFEEHRDQMVDMIRRRVEIEPPSDNKQAVDRCSAFAAEEFAAHGGRAQFHRVSDFGNHLQVDF